MTRTLAPATLAMQDQIVEALRDAAPMPLSTREIIDRLPLVHGMWVRPHDRCPTCTCEAHWHPFRHEGVRESNSRVTSITKRLERQGDVERFRSPVKGQPDGWRWIGD